MFISKSLNINLNYNTSQSKDILSQDFSTIGKNNINNKDNF